MALYARTPSLGRRLYFRQSPRPSLTSMVWLFLAVFFIFTISLLFQLIKLGSRRAEPFSPLDRSQVGVASHRHRANFEDITALLVYPNEVTSHKDRILAQMKFVPRSVSQKQKAKRQNVKRKLLLYTGHMEHPAGIRYFQDHQCPVKDCELSNDQSKLDESDVILFSTYSDMAQVPRVPRQVWAVYLLESPPNTSPISELYQSQINWTATYRHDSTLVTPYEKFVPINRSHLMGPPVRNYAMGKTDMVAWFVSNCRTVNERGNYVRELEKYIPVHIYGACGNRHCPRGSIVCTNMLNRQYKFYLAFENSNCRDYITEKFFVNGLQHDVVPIVMGAAPEDYHRVAPPHSFIHVEDFASPKELAFYLLLLDRDHDSYNAYFQWKGLWKTIDTLFPCRLCALAHDVERRGNSWYRNFNEWWQGPGVCIGTSTWKNWRKQHRDVDTEMWLLPDGWSQDDRSDDLPQDEIPEGRRDRRRRMRKTQD